MLVQLEGMGSYLIIAIVFLGLYIWFLSRLGVFKQKTSIATTGGSLSATPPDIIPRSNLASGRVEMSLPPDTPGIGVSEAEDVDDLEFVNEDLDNLLLREAEFVVEKIQDQLKHVASNPPNPEEVTSKIRSIINPYQLFNDTEYYGAINTFIALSVERECGIQLSSDEIKALWN
ncbi:hypothetical protein [Paraflavitalea sp. CAU 1676]|uniref:hypothetical protein n=1 Tax=Paraflavitalea sp. CAU 1676 TaxID=3032598 RepID=UPI0023D996C8|nr:hypothetical protein [Paraflavitalea sp. CAU 1676]MDF2190514.1 hypothetical protein [Paraflavitalea sp. CAU 1676]